MGAWFAYASGSRILGFFGDPLLPRQNIQTAGVLRRSAA